MPFNDCIATCCLFSTYAEKSNTQIRNRISHMLCSFLFSLSFRFTNCLSFPIYLNIFRSFMNPPKNGTSLPRLTRSIDDDDEGSTMFKVAGALFAYGIFVGIFVLICHIRRAFESINIQQYTNRLVLLKTFKELFRNYCCSVLEK